MTDILSPEEIERRLAHRQDRAAEAQAAAIAKRYRFIRSPLSAVNDYITQAVNYTDRLMFGLEDVDRLMRGTGRGELCYLTGRSHAGKTWLLMHLVNANRDKHLLFFTPDETEGGVMAKLIGLMHDLSSEEIEDRLMAGDRGMIRLLRRAQRDDFTNFIVLDEGLSFIEMSQTLAEAEQHWQTRCDGVLVDYLDLLPGDPDYRGTRGKSVGLKRWLKHHKVPGVVIHQPKRGGAHRGEQIGMDDLNQGGETEAMFVLGVHRPRQAEDRLAVFVDKNKRNGRSGTFEFFHDPRTGRIRGLRPEDFVVPGMIIPSARIAAAARDNVIPFRQPSA